MKKKKPKKDDSEKEGPLSFNTEAVSSQKIKEHWQKIADRINGIPNVVSGIDGSDNKNNGNSLVWFARVKITAC